MLKIMLRQAALQLALVRYIYNCHLFLNSWNWPMLDYVNNNPSAFSNAYFDFAWLKIYG